MSRFLLYLLALFLAWRTCGIGLRLPNQDPAAIGRGNAFVATADNPAAVYYNPAGLTQTSSHEVESGLYAISLRSNFRSPSGERLHSDAGYHVAPQFYYAGRLGNSRAVLGFGCYSPFGLGVEWPAHGPFRNTAISGRLEYLTANPVLACEVRPGLSVGAGPTLSYSRLTFSRGLGGPVPNDEFRFRGDDWLAGFNAGVLWRPVESWSFGLTYRAGGEAEYAGSAHALPYLPKESARARLAFPQVVAGGISFRPSTNWNFEVDVDWTDWRVTKDLRLVQGNGTRALTPLYWKSSFIYAAGLTRQWPRGYSASVGYFFAENSTREKFYNPAAPDTDLHVACAGVGWKGRRWHWAAAAQLAVGPDTTVSATTPSVRGTYGWLQHAFGISLGRKF